MREYKQLTPEEVNMYFSMGDEKLQRKKKQANNILHNCKSIKINYCKVMDIIKCTADALYNNSLNRVFNS